MTVITLEALAQAIDARTHEGVERAREEAEIILDIFGFDDEVVDNRLEPADRQVFYELERAGLLSTRSEETLLWNGQEWRTHYWVLRTGRLQAPAAPHPLLPPVAESPLPWPLPDTADARMYDTLPAEVWAHHSR
ncbi:MAG: DUF6015 family protein [Thermoplasmatota archaeon]